MANMRAMAQSRLSTTPIAVPRSNRIHRGQGITSMPAGKMVPIMAVPLLREDSVISGRLRFNLTAMETAEVLMNPMFVSLKAYLVPTLAFERFEGSMDVLNRSWANESFLGLPVVPYIEKQRFDVGATGGGNDSSPGKANPIHRYLGLHARDDQMINTMYIEAYNLIWNMRARNRTDKLSLRTRLQTDLAPAFWNNERFKHIVPSFDQARIEGEVALNIAPGAGKMPVKGVGFSTTNPPGLSDSPLTYRQSDGQLVTVDGTVRKVTSATGSNTNPMWETKDIGGNRFPDVFVELQNAGITVSLANIDLARKTQAFAKLREQYSGHSEDWLVNMLMDGLTVPDAALSQPMLLADKMTVFGMSKRYATDGGNLTESVANGATFIDIAIQTPRIGVGGVIMVVAEVTPDQLYERQRDPFFHAQDVEDFPRSLRDTLDTEKVDVVLNQDVDVDHTDPNGAFGYVPLNWKWNIEKPTIGGKFYRPDVDGGFNEDRQRFWAVETANPKLAEDFYVCTNIHTKPFVVTNQDPFECVSQGDLVINGNTVFGPALKEASDEYEKVLAVAPTDRIEQTP